MQELLPVSSHIYSSDFAPDQEHQSTPEAVIRLQGTHGFSFLTFYSQVYTSGSFFSSCSNTAPRFDTHTFFRDKRHQRSSLCSWSIRCKRRVFTFQSSHRSCNRLHPHLIIRRKRKKNLLPKKQGSMSANSSASGSVSRVRVFYGFFQKLPLRFPNRYRYAV